jgi:hypothetical protein
MIKRIVLLAIWSDQEGPLLISAPSHLLGALVRFSDRTVPNDNARSAPAARR